MHLLLGLALVVGAGYYLQRKLPAARREQTIKRAAVKLTPAVGALFGVVGREPEAVSNPIKRQYRDYFGGREPEAVSNPIPFVDPGLPTRSDGKNNFVEFVKMSVEKVKNAITPRGIRNNNPGNIRHGSDWRGQRKEQTDAGFIQFQSPAFGIRALTILLRNYQKLYDVTTLRQLITRYAPAADNNNENAYVDSLAKATGYGSDQALNFADDAVLEKIIPAIIRHENGEQPYDDAAIKHGIAIA